MPAGILTHRRSLLGGGGSASGLTAPSAFWRLEDANDSVGSLNLTNVNTVTFGAGKLGNAGHFAAASSQQLKIADNATLSMGDIDFSGALWVYFTTVATTNVYPLLYKWAAADFEYGLKVRPDTGAISFEVSTNGSNTFAATDTQTFAAATWYMLAFGHDSVNDTLNVSFNGGAWVPALHSFGVRDGTSDFQLGAFQAASYHDGRLDAVGIWRGHFLSNTELSTLYNGSAGREYYSAAWH
jgi:hypothetical protein